MEEVASSHTLASSGDSFLSHVPPLLHLSSKPLHRI